MNNDFYSSLRSACQQLGIQLNDDAVSKMGMYADLLCEYNEHINLTAIREPSEIAVKHFADSLAPLKYIDIKKGADIADIGTGAGFPGIPLLIARPDLSVTLIDSTAKKLKFIEEACSRIGLSPHIVHIRAEEAGRDRLYREKYDYVFARAVAELRVLAEYCIPLVRCGGLFAPLKAEISEELKAAENSLSALSGSLEAVYDYELGMCGKRSIAQIRKISQTSLKYPRVSTQISKKPL